MRRMTNLQASILRLLQQYYAVFVSPTEIGEAVGGKPYHAASSWASPKCKRMVELGWVERSDRGHYKITTAGRRAMEGET